MSKASNTLLAILVPLCGDWLKSPISMPAPMTAIVASTDFEHCNKQLKRRHCNAIPSSFLKIVGDYI